MIEGIIIATTFAQISVVVFVYMEMLDHYHRRMRLAKFSRDTGHETSARYHLECANRIIFRLRVFIAINLVVAAFATYRSDLIVNIILSITGV